MINIVFNPIEIAHIDGLYNKLCLLSESLTRKGIICKLRFEEDYPGGEVAITLGTAVCPDALISIPLPQPFEKISEKLYEIAGRIIYGNSRQITVKLFGALPDLDDKIQIYERSSSDLVTLFYYREGLITTLKIICSDAHCESAVSDIFSAFQQNIYAEEDVSLDVRLLELLDIRNKILSVAESLTGGNIVSTLIGNAGASKSIFEGLVTYSNDSKISRLYIDSQIIKDHGAVSYETAYEMAAGLLSTKSCDIALATTGIAGPSGGTLTKPVGLTFISVGTAEGIHVYKHIFSGTRQAIREAASNAAMFYAIKILKNTGIDYNEIQIV